MRQCESAPPFVIWMADLRDQREHGVTLDQAEATAQAGTGIYPSLCGINLLPEAMTTRPGPRCLECDRCCQRLISAGKPSRKPLRQQVCAFLRRGV